jgi:hypothetical protein
VGVSSKLYVIGPNGELNGTGRALLRPGQIKDTFTIYNIGTTTVYLNTDNQPTGSADGAPLSPGSVVPWQGGKSLYATCATTGQIFVSDNPQVPFDAGAIAAQILDQGLAQDIADAIKITGTPPIDTNVLINSTTNPNNGNTAVGSAIIDVSQYQSINLVCTAFSDPAINVRMDVVWRDSTGVATFTESVFVGTGGRTLSAMAVRGPKASFSVIIAGAVGAPATIKVFGSYKSVQSTYCVLSGYGEMGNGQLDGLYETGFQTWYGTIPVSTTWVAQLDHVVGPAKIIMRYVSTNTAGVTRLVRTPNTIYGLTTYLAESAMPTTAGLMQYDDIVLPPVPLEISMANTSATQTLAFRATIVYGRPYSA